MHGLGECLGEGCGPDIWEGDSFVAAKSALDGPKEPSCLAPTFTNDTTIASITSLLTYLLTPAAEIAPRHFPGYLQHSRADFWAPNVRRAFNWTAHTGTHQTQHTHIL